MTKFSKVAKGVLGSTNKEMGSYWLIQFFWSHSILIRIEIFGNATLGGGIFDHTNIQYQRI